MNRGEAIELVHRFAPWHRHDRNFFLAYVIFAWLAILIGFAPDVIARFTGNADYVAPWVLIVHVWSFCAWVTLLTLQVGLVRFGKTPWHMRLGLVLSLLVPVMVVSALSAEVYARWIHFASGQTDVETVVFPMTNVLIFTATACGAFLLRRNSPAHKRMILLATSIILSAATFRVMRNVTNVLVGEAAAPGYISEWVGTYFWAGPVLLVALAALYDKLTRGKVHGVLAIGLPAYVLAYLAASSLAQADWWAGTARELLGL